MKCQFTTDNKECGRECKNFYSLSAHARQKHKIEIKEYYDKYLKKENEGICLECGKETNFKSLKDGYQKFCCNSCGTKSPETQKKMKNTNKERHGYESAMQSPKILEKYKETCLTNSGYKNPSQIPEIKELKREKSQEKFGTDFPFQAKEVINLIKKINLKKNIKDPDRPKKIKEKINQTIQRKNIENLNRLKEIEEKKKIRSRKNWNSDYWSSSVKGISFHKNRARKTVEAGLKDGKRFSPFHSKNEKPIFNEIQLYIFPYKLLEDQEIGGCWPDKLINEDIKAAFELDGVDHEYESQKERDKRKDKVYISLGFMPIRIKESDWFEDKELQIIKVQETIKFLKQVNQLNNGIN